MSWILTHSSKFESNSFWSRYKVCQNLHKIMYTVQCTHWVESKFSFSSSWLPKLQPINSKLANQAGKLNPARSENKYIITFQPGHNGIGKLVLFHISTVLVLAAAHGAKERNCLWWANLVSAPPANPLITRFWGRAFFFEKYFFLWSSNFISDFRLNLFINTLYIWWTNLVSANANALLSEISFLSSPILYWTCLYGQTTEKCFQIRTYQASPACY